MLSLQCDNMMASSGEFERKLKFYRAQIRKEQIQQKKRGLRQLMVQELSLRQIQALVRQGTDISSPCLQQLLENCMPTLLSPFSSIKSQTCFWEHFLRYLNNNLSQCSGILPMLAEFTFQLQKLSDWEVIEAHPEYADAVVQIIELLMSDLHDSDKLLLASWISATERIDLVYQLVRSVTSHPSPQTAPQLYTLIEKAIKSHKIEDQIRGANVLLDLAKFGTGTGYREKQFGIRLMVLLGENSLKEYAIHFWPPLVYMLNASPQLLRITGEAGLVSICAMLISSSVQGNVFGGLSILKLFIDKGMVLFLAPHGSPLETPFWLSLCLKQNLHCHRKIDILRLFFQLLGGTLFGLPSEVLVGLCQNCNLRGMQVVDMVEGVWQNSSRDEQTVQATLDCIFFALLNVSECPLRSHPRLVLNMLEMRNMLIFVQKCVSSKNGDISDIASRILERRESILKREMEVEL